MDGTERDGKKMDGTRNGWHGEGMAQRRGGKGKEWLWEGMAASTRSGIPEPSLSIGLYKGSVYKGIVTWRQVVGKSNFPSGNTKF